MANFIAYTTVNMSGTDAPFNGTIVGANASQITINYPTGKTDVFFGRFTYSADGNEVFGTLTGYEGYIGSALGVQINFGNVDAHTASNLVLTGQNQALLRLALTGNDVISGSIGNDVLNGYGGNDVIIPGPGNDSVDSGSGFDSVLIHSNRFSTSATISNGVVSLNGADGSDMIVNAERIQFNDVVVALDIQGNAGNAYRLYQAAFDRVPDQAGLSFWTHQLDLGLNIFAAAQGFVNSSEFRNVYGTNPSNTHIVDLMYQNVLGRAGEPAGINFWVGQLDRGLPVGELLQGFAASSENHGIVDPVLVTGITLNSTAFLV